jgi:hypothetical protein
VQCGSYRGFVLEEALTSDTRLSLHGFRRYPEQVTSFRVSYVGDYGGDSMIDVDGGRELLIQLRQSLQQMKNRLVEIEGHFNLLGVRTAANRPMTLRDFTEKQLNDKRPADQADLSSLKAPTTKYSTR